MNLLTNCLVICAFSVSLPIQDVVILLKGDSFEVTLTSENREKFISASYDLGTEKLNFVTKQSIHTIIIYEKGEIAFVLPVLAERVSLGKSMFDSESSYKLGFNFDNSEELLFADMVMR